MDNNKKEYSPNIISDVNNITVGQFKTVDDILKFPLKNYWNLNENSLKEWDKIIIICDWNKSIQDSTKFIVVFIGKGDEIKALDMNMIEVK